MAHSAEYIYKERQGFIDLLQDPLRTQHQNLTSSQEIAEIKFQPAYPSACSLYLETLKKMRLKERDLGLTLQGPHRDDLSFLIQSKPAKIFASEGQKKTMITALRLAQWQHLAKTIDDLPFMGLDDFGGTLDPQRLQYLKDCLNSMGQVFITTPTKEDFPKANFFHIDHGKIS